MSRRTSVLLEDEQWNLLARKAKRDGRTVSEEIRAAIDRTLDEDAASGDWFLELAELGKEFEWKGPPIGPGTIEQEIIDGLMEEHRKITASFSGTARPGGKRSG